MRAALTTLGIVIGIAAVITMVEIGQGSSTAMKRIIESMGANTLLVLPGQPNAPASARAPAARMTLTPGDCDAIVRECPAVTVAAPIVRASAQVIYGNRNWLPQQMYGTTPDFLDVRNWSQMAEGECFTDRDVRNAAEVCVVGQTLVHELFQDESPVGKEIRIENVMFKVVGVLSKKGANMMGRDQDDILLAPWTSIKFRVTGANGQPRPEPSTTTITTTNTLNQIYPTCRVQPRPVPGALGLGAGRYAPAGALHQRRARSWSRPRVRGRSRRRSARSPTCCASGTASRRTTRTISASAT